MQTNTEQLSEVEYALTIEIPAAELAPEWDKVLRTHRKRASLKGFRPGAVPMQMIRKLYGQAVAYEVAEQKVQEVLNQELFEGDQYKIVGRPILEELQADLDADLKAKVRFGVRPEFEVRYPEGETLLKLDTEVDDAQVDSYLERLKRQNGKKVEVEGPIDETMTVTVDVRTLDGETGTPVLGSLEENQVIDLTSTDLLPAFKEALLGKQVGDEAPVTVHHDHDHGDEHHHHPHDHKYQLTIKKIEKTEPAELTEELLKDASQGRATTEEEFRGIVAKDIGEVWEEQAKNLITDSVQARLIELNPIPVPESAVEVYLDYFVKDVRERNKGELPAGFDEASFRMQNRAEAENLARWMFIRDEILAGQAFEVTEEDRDAQIRKMARNDDLFPIYKEMYEKYPRMRDEMDERVLTEKVIAFVADKMEAEVVDREAYSTRAQELKGNTAEEPSAEEEQA